jgi:putative nucleotidyltransferase with HDIG domain
LARGAPADEAWAIAQLTPGEQALWARMSDPDRRHAVGVARAVASDERAVTAAALLHDVGKIESGLGTVARVGATIAGAVRGRDRWWGGRVGAYLHHDELGATLLDRAGSDALTIAWAREHHLPPERWTVPREIGLVLKAADDD